MTDKKTLQQQFSNSIRRGTGEALLILQRHPDIDFSADIIKAALWNYAYDAQSEGSRAIYIAELMALSKHQDKIRKAILTGLATEEKDTWALVQLFDLAKILAQKGDQDARQAIYNRFYTKIIAGADWCGYTDIAKSKYLKTDRLLEFASGALKFFTGPDIRQFAIDKLSQTKAPYRYLDLLVANYKEGDSRLLTDIALAFKNVNDIHAIADGYTDIYAANPTKECKEPLEVLYAKLTCGVCRGIILKRLIDNNVLSEQLKQEMQFDSYTDNRSLLT